MHAKFSALLATIAVLSIGAVGEWRMANAAPASAPNTPMAFAPHRAVYDLKLLKTRGNRQLEAVRGRILYDFSGNACEGYALQFRQVSELDSGEGKKSLTDLRTTTWEDGAARTFRFNSENRMDSSAAEIVSGTAEKTGKAGEVSLKKPKPTSFKIPADALFPTEHMRKIVEVARAGQSILETPAFDGSDNGQKLYRTLTVIGKQIPADRKIDDAAASKSELSGMARWPVTISYFDDKLDHTGEQMPVYSLQFELLENGISRALVLDYQDFVIAGELSSLELKTEKPCK
jgi:hypothetical protein